LLTFRGKTLEVLILFELSLHLVGGQVAISAKPIATMRPGAARPETLLPVGTARRALRHGAYLWIDAAVGSGAARAQDNTNSTMG
jgi:hypothetical protein